MNYRRIFLLSSFLILLLTSLLSQNIYILVLFSVLAWGLVPFDKYWDSRSILLLLFSFFYAIVIILEGRVKSGFLTISYLITPCIFYRLGNYIISEYHREEQRMKLLLFISTSFLFSTFILTIIDISVVGLVNTDRTLLGTSSTDDAMAATLYGLMTSVGIGCLGGVFANRSSIIVRISFAVISFMSLLVVVHLVNRTGLVLFIVCILVILLYKTNYSLHKFLPLFLILLISMVVLFKSGIIDSSILDAYSSREDNYNYGLSTAGGRTELWLHSIKELIVNPFGWEQSHYAHNLWLDVARVGGWFALIPFFILTCQMLTCFLKLLRTPYSDFNLLIITMNVSTLLAASMEPVIEGSILFFSLLMFLWGVSYRIQKEEHYRIVNSLRNLMNQFLY